MGHFNKDAAPGGINAARTVAECRRGCQAWFRAIFRNCNAPKTNVRKYARIREDLEPMTKVVADATQGLGP